MSNTLKLRLIQINYILFFLVGATLVVLGLRLWGDCSSPLHDLGRFLILPGLLTWLSLIGFSLFAKEEIEKLIEPSPLAKMES
jgi:hypothetical protein